jgi:hypothetical protein
MSEKDFEVTEKEWEALSALFISPDTRGVIEALKKSGNRAVGRDQLPQAMTIHVLRGMNGNISRVGLPLRLQMLPSPTDYRELRLRRKYTGAKSGELSEGDRIKAEIAPPDMWSPLFTGVLHYLVDSFDKEVPVKELSKIVHPTKFNSSVVRSINIMLNSRKLPYQIVIVDDNPHEDFAKLKVKLTRNVR